MTINWLIRKIKSKLSGKWEREFYEYAYLQEYKKWQKHKSPAAPHYLKQKAILHYKEQNKINVLVETGTFIGDMIYMMEPYFEKLYTIELSRELYERAQKRFAGKTKINLLNGDSGELLGKVVDELNVPAIFWLDGHYSAGPTAKADLNTPIRAELQTIFRSGLPHVILIDDARLFNGQEDYPTIDEVRVITEQLTTGRYSFKVEDDIIHILPE